VTAEISDRANWTQQAPPAQAGFRRTSSFIPMTDGVRLAADIYLPDPAEPGNRLPSVIIMTPYYRALQLAGDGPFPPEIEKLQYDAGMWGPGLARHGIAVVVVEVRGGGASFGTRSVGRRPDGGRDDVDVVDWVVAQPWSNGRVGATGISAPGLAALNLLTAKHPAVRAVAPLWTAFDMYASTHPGGTTLTAFVKANYEGTSALDQNRIGELVGDTTPGLKGVIQGLRPVDEDVDGSLLAAAVEEHKGNLYIHDDLLAITYRDDVFRDGGSTAASSPSTQVPDLRASEAAIYSYAGWYDGAFTTDLVHLHLSVGNPGSRLIIGPWGHGGHTYDSPFATPGRPTDFDHDAELAAFFHRHLGEGTAAAADEPTVRYFTVGAEEWRTAESWPPPSEPLSAYFAPSGELTLGTSPSGDGNDEYDVDFGVGSGPRSRWSNSSVPVDYGNRAEIDQRLLTYTSPALDADTEVTGHPLLELFVSANVDDFLAVVYLEDVDPDGRVRVVTEGVQRALFSAETEGDPPHAFIGPYRSFLKAEAAPVTPGEVVTLRFGLPPVSHLFRAGHRIRLAIAGTDDSNFPRTPESGDVRLSVQRSAQHPSRIVLPVVGG
jgi:putative CocE/NonD family hydrolase